MVKNLPANSRDVGWIPGSGSSLGGGKQQPTPVFSPENFHGQRSLTGYSPWGRKELDMTERTHIFAGSPKAEPQTKACAGSSFGKRSQVQYFGHLT